jgi:hypothetical protein
MRGSVGEFEMQQNSWDVSAAFARAHGDDDLELGFGPDKDLDEDIVDLDEALEDDPLADDLDDELDLEEDELDEDEDDDGLDDLDDDLIDLDDEYDTLDEGDRPIPPPKKRYEE